MSVHILWNLGSSTEDNWICKQMNSFECDTFVRVPLNVSHTKRVPKMMANDTTAIVNSKLDRKLFVARQNR